jgi:hypothetical protein
LAQGSIHPPPPPNILFYWLRRLMVVDVFVMKRQ